MASDGDTIIFLDQSLAYRGQLNSDAVICKALNIQAAYLTSSAPVAADNLTYTATAGQPNVYQAARRNAVRVVDLLVGPTGFSYTNVPSTAACSALPGSWYSDGTNVYMHTIDDSAPDSSRILALISIRLFEFASTARASNGSFYLEGFCVHNGPQGIKVTGTAAYDIGFTTKNCHFFHGHFSTADGVQLVDVYSSVIQNTLVAHTGKDGFNYHQSNRVTNLLEIDTEAHSIRVDHGAGYTLNVSTAHDGIKGIRLGDRLQDG